MPPDTALRTKAGAHCLSHRPAGSGRDLDLEHHDDKDKEDHDGPGIDDNFQQGQQGGAQKVKEGGHAEEGDD